MVSDISKKGINVSIVKVENSLKSLEHGRTVYSVKAEAS